MSVEAQVPPSRCNWLHDGSHEPANSDQGSPSRTGDTPVAENTGPHVDERSGAPVRIRKRCRRRRRMPYPAGSRLGSEPEAGFRERSLEEMEKEDRDQLRRADKRTRKRQRQIQKAVEAGEMHRARGLQRRLLASRDTHFSAAREAVRKEKGIGCRIDAAYAVAAHTRNSPRTVGETITVFAKRKRSGGFRALCKYAPEDKAAESWLGWHSNRSPACGRSSSA